MLTEPTGLQPPILDMRFDGPQWDELYFTTMTTVPLP
jgi:hypothetical protein